MKNNWEYKQLGDICDKGSSNLMQKNLEIIDNGFEVFGASGSLGKIDFYQQEAPYVGIVKDGSGVGRCNLYPAKSSLLGTMQYIIAKNCVSNEYLCYLMQSLNLSKYVNGAAIPHIYFRDYKKEIVPVPPLNVQERIVAELDKINETIEDCRELLRNLDALAQSLFYDFFGDPISNSKVWNISKVSDNFITGSGGTPSKKIDEYWNSNDIPWIGSNMCQNKVLYETDGKFISTLGLNNSSAKLLYEDTILVALVGATIGKVALLKTNTSTNQNIGFIKPNKDVANPIFLFYLFQGLYPLFTGIGDGKFKMVNLSFIRNLPIILPPLELQEKFAERIEQIEAQKEAVESTIAELQTLLDSRMDYWFN